MSASMWHDAHAAVDFSTAGGSSVTNVPAHAGRSSGHNTDALYDLKNTCCTHGLHREGKKVSVGNDVSTFWFHLSDFEKEYISCIRQVTFNITRHTFLIIPSVSLSLELLWSFLYWSSSPKNCSQALVLAFNSRYLSKHDVQDIAGGRERKVTSAPNLSRYCYKLLFRSPEFSSALSSQRLMSSPRLTLFSLPATAKEQRSKTCQLGSPFQFFIWLFACDVSDQAFIFPTCLGAGWGSTRGRYELEDLKTHICKSEIHSGFGESYVSCGVPVTGCYKPLFVLCVCLPVMFTYIVLWHLEAEGSAQEGKSLNKHGMPPTESVY